MGYSLVLAKILTINASLKAILKLEIQELSLRKQIM